VQTTTRATVSTSTLEVARRFGTELRQSEAVTAFLTAQQDLAGSTTTQTLLQEYRELHRSLGWRARTGALEPAEAEQLTAIQQRVQADSNVLALQAAQDQLQRACQDAADVLSATVGIDLASSCGPGGCG